MYSCVHQILLVLYVAFLWDVIYNYVYTCTWIGGNDGLLVTAGYHGVSVAVETHFYIHCKDNCEHVV